MIEQLFYIVKGEMDKTSIAALRAGASPGVRKTRSMGALHVDFFAPSWVFCKGRAARPWARLSKSLHQIRCDREATRYGELCLQS